MIIRSQDKTKIFNFEQIRKIDCDNGMIVVDSTSILGEYSTEEKAIKVLDMICHFADKVHLEKLQLNPIRTDGAVFQMPLDEDVEV